MSRSRTYRVRELDERNRRMRANAICSHSSQHHSTTRMTGINKAHAQIEAIPCGEEISWQRIADTKVDCVTPGMAYW
jgi:hypothetical protein